MKKTETKQILELLTQLTEAVIGPAAGRPPTEPKPSISERVDKLDTRVSEVQLGLATLAVDTKAQFQKSRRAVPEASTSVRRSTSGSTKWTEASRQPAFSWWVSWS